MKIPNYGVLNAQAPVRSVKSISTWRWLGAALGFSLYLPLSTLPSYGQDIKCEVASQCYAIAFNAYTLAETLREQGEMVKWDEVKLLKEAHLFFMGSVIKYCEQPNYWSEVEDISERDFDRIIEGSRSRSFLDILSQYKAETKSCMESF